MIEKVLAMIVRELGTTGILVLGLYIIFGGPMRKMAKHIEIINGEIGELKDTIKDCTMRICDQLHGKN